MMYLDVEAITKHFGDTCVAHGVGFSLEQGDIGALLGPSGCGKTTLLRMIAGFEDPDGGAIHLHGQPLWTGGRGVAAEDRHIGMVFQDYALFPHLTVWENIAFGMKHVSRAEIKATIEELLVVTGLAGVEKRYPHELSGGQQQRVALARAIAPKPRCLLMDEPFSNLDVTLRESLSAEVREIIKRFGITALMVTHNQHEAFAMADRIGVMMAGRILQWDTPEGLYHKPETLSVARFIGEGSLLKGTLTPTGPWIVAWEPFLWGSKPETARPKRCMCLFGPRRFALPPPANRPRHGWKKAAFEDRAEVAFSSFPPAS